MTGWRKEHPDKVGLWWWWPTASARPFILNWCEVRVIVHINREEDKQFIRDDDDGWYCPVEHPPPPSGVPAGGDA